jgi:hypothetical protein
MTGVWLDDDGLRRDIKTRHEEFFHFDGFAIRPTEGVTIATADGDEGRPAFLILHRGDGTMHLIYGLTGVVVSWGPLPGVTMVAYLYFAQSV